MKTLTANFCRGQVGDLNSVGERMGRKILSGMQKLF